MWKVTWNLSKFPKEIFRIATSNKFEEPKLLCRVQPFQNRRFISFRKAPRGKGLSLEIGSKDAYFSASLHLDSQKYVKFQWNQKLYQSLCLCFWLALAPRVLTKLVKVAILRRLNLLLILCLDDILLIVRFQKELIMARETLTFLLQNLSFLINFEKSVLQPFQKVEFFRIFVDSRDITFTLPQEKVNAIID